MTEPMNIRFPVPLILCLWSACLLSACTSEQVIHANVPAATVAQQAPAEQRLLDVAIAVFDPGLSGEEKTNKNSKSYRNIREAEARYLAYTLRETLEGSGQWGVVRLVPHQDRSVDLMVTGEIVESSGSELVLDVRVSDATGRTWFSKRYSALASKYAYVDEHFSEKEPFQAVYTGVANDMLAAREKFSGEELATMRNVAELRFAADLLPGAFADYLVEDSVGAYSVNRLPAADDPMLLRVRRIRQRDFILLDTLDGYYARFYRDMKPAYREWLKSNFEETIELKKLQRSARNRMGMGAAAMVAGVAGAVKSDSSAGQAVSVATAAGGAAVFASGVKKYDQSRIHLDALGELSESFQADLQPKIVEVEGRTITLTGSAEAQYETWRTLLRRIYTEETGLPHQGVP